MDACVEMLKFAEQKLKDAIEKDIIGEIIGAKLPALPFDDGSFDAVMFHYVSTPVEPELKLQKMQLFYFYFLLSASDVRNMNTCISC